MRLPRAQCSHSCRSRVSRFSSRIARSRYLSLISSSVAGIWPSVLDDTGACPLACMEACSRGRRIARSAAGAATLRSRSCPAARSGADLRLYELQRLKVDQALALVKDVGVAQALEELLGTVEVAHPDLHRAEPLGHVAVRSRPRDHAVLSGE